MADYLTQFSCWLDVGSTAMSKRAMRRFYAFQRLFDRTGDTACFEMEADPTDACPGGLWIHDGDGFGDPDHVISFLLASARRLDLSGRWGFTWSHGCSRPRLNSFGGGACVLDFTAGTVIGDVSCSDWLDEMIQVPKRFVIHSASEAQAGQGGYWSNEDGWTALDQVTIFTWSERKTYGLPASLGDDAQWIEIAEGNVSAGMDAHNAKNILQSAPETVQAGGVP